MEAPPSDLQLTSGDTKVGSGRRVIGGRRAVSSILAINADTIATAATPSQAPAVRGGWGEESTGSPGSSSKALGGGEKQESAAPRASRGSSTGEATIVEGRVADTGDDVKLPKVSRRKAAQLAQESGDGAYRNHWQEDTDAGKVVEIPDLETGSDDLEHQVAAAPVAQSVKVQGIEELEKESGAFNLPAVSSDVSDIDLSMLTACLCPADQVAEDMAVWDPDRLLMEIASQMATQTDGDNANTSSDFFAGTEVPI